jgi:hypothetical protein
MPGALRDCDWLVDAIVLDAVRKAEDLFPKYVAAIERHLQKTEA